MKTRTINNYPLELAGEVWVVPHYQISTLSDGTECVSLADIEPIARAVVVQICAKPTRITPDQFTLACDVLDVSYSTVATHLGMSRSAITKWIGRANPWTLNASRACKLFFLGKISESALTKTRVPTVPLHIAVSVDDLLPHLGAVLETLASPCNMQPGVRRLSEIEDTEIG